jgi:hypothetical protein
MINHDYSSLRQEARELYTPLGIKCMSNHMGVDGSRARNIARVADKHLPTVIGDLEDIAKRMGLKNKKW